MNKLLQDFRFAIRLLAKTPGFTATAILVLALGIGVNTGIFSVVYAFVFSPRPFPEADRVVQIYTQDKKEPSKYRTFSYPHYRELRESNEAFSGILAHTLAMAGIGEGTSSRRSFVGVVSANYFDVLGVKLVRGRTFTTEEEKPGNAATVAIASYVFWKKSGFNPQLVGSSIRVNEHLYTVVGIAPENFTGTMMLFGPELYFPLSAYDTLNNDFDAMHKRSLEQADSYNLFLVGRLKTGVTKEVANQSLTAAAVSLTKAFPVEMKDQSFVLGTLPRLSTSDAPNNESDLTVLGLLLLGMTGIVLLIACLNLANMLLARGAARRKEFAIRMALGGGRMRLIRQLLTEGSILALAGGSIGMVLAVWSSDLLIGSMSVLIPVTFFYAGPPVGALLVSTILFCLISTLFFALGPALKLSKVDVLSGLKENSGDDAVVRRWKWMPRNPLVVAQIALSLALLTCAGLFIRGALKAGAADLGFHADNTLVVEADASLGGYDEARGQSIYRHAADRLGTIPGVQAASIASTVPFGFITIGRPVQRAGLRPPAGTKPSSAEQGLAFSATWNAVGSDYFSVLGLSLVRGRGFTESESSSPGAPLVAVVDEVLARKLWPDGNALGQSIQFADRDAVREAGDGGPAVGASSTINRQKDEVKTLQVVGVVPSIRTSLFSKEQGGAIYVPFAQGYTGNVTFHIRTVANTQAAAAALIDTVRLIMLEAAPNVPVFKIRTFKQHMESSAELWITRIGALLFSMFGGLALILAVVGLYGVKAYSVARRTREIGIRMALGAEPSEVQSMILREGLMMTMSGTGLGLLLAIGLGQLCGSLLFEVSPLDPLAFAVSTLVLFATTMVACWLPARKATRVNPLTALRAD